MPTELKEIFDKLSELKKQFEHQVKIKGSVEELIGRLEQYIREYEVALDRVQELISTRDQLLKSALDAEAQLKQLRMQLDQETENKNVAEAQLLEAQAKIHERLDEFEAVTKRAEKLDSQVNSLSSHLHVTEKEKMDLELETMSLKQQLEEVTSALKFMEEKMEKETAFFKRKVSELRDDLKNVKLEKVDKEHELSEALSKLSQQETDMDIKYDQLKRAKTDLEDKLQQANAKIREMASDDSRSRVDEVEAELIEVREQLKQETREKAELQTRMRKQSVELERIQQLTRDINDDYLALEEGLKRREEEEKSLKAELKQAENNVAKQSKLLRQQSEEIHRINAQKEELRRQLTVYGHGDYGKDTDISPTEYGGVIGMFYSESIIYYLLEVLWPLPEKKRRVLCDSRPCNQDC